jgi:hypothetical protein
VVVAVVAAGAVHVGLGFGLDGDADGFAARWGGGRCSSGRGVVMRMVMVVIVPARRAVDMAWFAMRGLVVVSMGVTMTARGVGATLGLERCVGFLHGEVHGAQHVGQHMVRLDLEVVCLQLDLHVAVAQVVGGAGQVKRTAMFSAWGDDQHRLGGGADADQRAVFGHQHVAAPHHGASAQEHAQLATCAVGGIEAAFLAHVPVELDGVGALEQHGGQALALGKEFVDGQHREMLSKILTSRVSGGALPGRLSNNGGHRPCGAAIILGGLMVAKRLQNWACMFAAAAAFSGHPAAQAMTSIDLPQLYDGNMLGLAYRSTDGHLFVTQNATVSGNDLFNTPFIYELSESGTLLNTQDLRTVVPGISDVLAVNYLPGSQELAVQGVTVNETWDVFVQHSVILSSDLTTLKKSTTIGDFSWQLGYQTADETYWMGAIDGMSSVKITPPLDGSASSGVVLNGVADCCGEYSSIYGVAPSWSNGFFVIAEGTLGGFLQEYDRQGHMIRGMKLDSDVFGYHPLALDTDLANHRLFLSMNNQKVFIMGESEFLAAAVVPEPGTWAVMGLGMALMPLARRRALRA